MRGRFCRGLWVGLRLLGRLQRRSGCGGAGRRCSVSALRLRHPAVTPRSHARSPIAPGHDPGDAQRVGDAALAKSAAAAGGRPSRSAAKRAAANTSPAPRSSAGVARSGRAGTLPAPGSSAGVSIGLTRPRHLRRGREQGARDRSPGHAQAQPAGERSRRRGARWSRRRDVGDGHHPAVLRWRERSGTAAALALALVEHPRVAARRQQPRGPAGRARSPRGRPTGARVSLRGEPHEVGAGWVDADTPARGLPGDGGEVQDRGVHLDRPLDRPGPGQQPLAARCDRSPRVSSVWWCARRAGPSGRARRGRARAARARPPRARPARESDQRVRSPRRAACRAL